MAVATVAVGSAQQASVQQLGRSCPLSFFSLQQQIFFLFIFGFSNPFQLVQFQMHATSTPLLQNEHIGYVFGVESCKGQDGAVPLLD